MQEANSPLASTLNLDRRTVVVDIGANPVDGDPPYKEMLSKGLCGLIGFEPQAVALAQLNAKKGPHETYARRSCSRSEARRLRQQQFKEPRRQTRRV